MSHRRGRKRQDLKLSSAQARVILRREGFSQQEIRRVVDEGRFVDRTFASGTRIVVRKDPRFNNQFLFARFTGSKPKGFARFSSEKRKEILQKKQEKRDRQTSFQRELERQAKNAGLSKKDRMRIQKEALRQEVFKRSSAKALAKATTTLRRLGFKLKRKQVASPLLLTALGLKTKDRKPQVPEIGAEKPKPLTKKEKFERRLDTTAGEVEALAELGKRRLTERKLPILPISIALGIARTELSLVRLTTNPVKFAKEQFEAIKHPIKTFRLLKQDFLLDPVAVATEFYTFSKLLGLAGRLGRKSPVGRFIHREWFLTRNVPKNLRSSVRKILDAADAQAGLNPIDLKRIKKVDLVTAKSVNRVEAQALNRTLRQTDSVLFGSAASNILSKGKTPKPGDIDIGVSNARQFVRVFRNNLPRNQRANYLLRGQKVIRKNTGQKVFEIKPLSRLIPQKSAFTGRGRLPVGGIIKRSKPVVTLTNIKNLVIDIQKKKLKILTTSSKKVKTLKSLRKELRSLQKELRKQGKQFKFSDLPKSVRIKVSDAFDVPTQKLVTVEGIKIVGFGEQTLRKALGTLQVLLEKNVRRAKDPQGFLIGLEVQLEAIKRSRPKTPFGRIQKNRRIRKIRDAIKLLKSKSFARALEKVIPELTKQFPLVSRISVSKLKKIDLTEVRRRVRRKLSVLRIKPLPKRPSQKVTFRAIKKRGKRIRRRIVPGKKKGRKPSVLPKGKKPSRLPKSKLPKKRRPSKLPPSKLPKKKRPSKLPPSKLPKKKRPSKLPPSKIPVPSRLPKKIRLPKAPRSKLPKVKAKVSKIPSRRSKKAIAKLMKKPKEVKKIVAKITKDFQFVFLADIVSKLFDIRATKKEKKRLLKVGRVFTGREIRKIVR